MSEFYQIDSTRISLREYLYWHKNPVSILVVLLLKLFRSRIRCSSDDPNVDSTLPFLVPELPSEITGRFELLTNEVMRLGFCDPVYHVIHDPLTRTTVYWATFRHQKQKLFARIHHRVWLLSGGKSDRGLFPMLLTKFTDGTFFVSSSGKPDMDTPPTVKMNRMRNAPVEKLFTTHLKLAEAESRNKMESPIRNQDDLIAAIEEHHVLLRDFNLARGVFRPRTTEETVQADTQAALETQSNGPQSEYSAVLAELAALQSKKPNWNNTILMLLGSLALFFVIGASQWDWRFTLIIIPVLFIHELGHWLMMKWFGYRNLRMFFIPLFGAAVTGQNWNIPGWKKALVSLAGPLPGIFVGAVLLLLPWAMNYFVLRAFAVLLVVVNGLNLIPMLPLDGGFILHAVLFSRNRWLDLCFRAVAALGLFMAGTHGFGIFFKYLGILLAISLPAAFKMGKIVDELKTSSPPLPQPDGNSIPLESAEKIIPAVKTILPKYANSRLIATRTLNVYERLNAHPPGFLATLGILALYLGSFALAVGPLVWMVYSARSIGSPSLRPKAMVECSHIRTWPQSSQENGAATERKLIFATLRNEVVADAAFNALTNTLPPQTVLEKFGLSLIFSASPDDKRAATWRPSLAKYSKLIFISSSNNPAAATFLFTVPDTAATKLEFDLKSYFETNDVPQVPPWAPKADLANNPNLKVYVAKSRAVLRNHQEMEVYCVVFDDPIIGLPAFTKWLCEEGCTDIKYRLRLLK